jgi:hypothetical protein
MVAREGVGTAPALVPGIVVVCVAACWGCGPAPDGRGRTQSWPTLSELSAAYTPEQAAVLDLGLTASITLQLLLDRDVSGRRINVDTRERVVVLKGRLATEAERARAMRIAGETHGVAWVVDQLTIHTSTTAGANLPERFGR